MRYLGYSASADSGFPDYKKAIEHPGLQNDDAINWVGNSVQLGPTGQDGLDELKQIGDLAAAAGYLDSRVAIDLSVVRGLEYYTGPVFEVELLLETKDEKGRPVRFGSVGGGGRYDGLVSRFRG